MPAFNGQPVAASSAIAAMNNIMLMGLNIQASSVNPNNAQGAALVQMGLNLINSSGSMNAASAVAYSAAMSSYVATSTNMIGFYNTSGIIYKDALLQASSVIDSLIGQGRLGLQVSQ